MPNYIDVEIDPGTKQPIASASSSQPQTSQQPAQQPAQQQNPVADWSPERFAAQSAERQMLEARARGGTPTQEDFEKARASAYQQAMETQKEMALDAQRRAGELKKQEAFQQFEQFAPRNMSAEESKDASGLMNAHQAIMMLYHQNQDIPANHLYRAAVGGEATKAAAESVDPTIRGYEAVRGANIIGLGRGLLQDTGQVAGKEEAQELIKKLMPGPGDSVDMSGKKTIDMVQMELNGLRSKIDGLPGNVDTSPLKNQYRNSYRDYAALLNTYGSDAQRNYPASNPDDLWGAVKGAPATPVIKAAAPVQGGISAQGSATLNAALSGQAAGATANKDMPFTTTTNPVTGQPQIAAVPGNRSWSAAGPAQSVPNPVATNLAATGAQGAPTGAGTGWSAAGPSQFAGPTGPQVGMTGSERVPPQAGLAQLLQYLQQNAPLKPGGPAAENPWTLMGGQPGSTLWGIGR